MIRIAAKDQSSNSLLDDELGRELTMRAERAPKRSSAAFVGFSVWRRDEVGDANLSDEQVFVLRNGQVHFLEPRYELENFSPDGLSWGYRGSASAQLAIAILMELIDDWNRVRPLWPIFHDEFVVKLPQYTNWTADGSTVLAIALALERRMRKSRKANSRD